VRPNIPIGQKSEDTWEHMASGSQVTNCSSNRDDCQTIIRQSNLAKGDIALLSHSPGGSTPREVGPSSCIWDHNFWEWGGSKDQ